MTVVALREGRIAMAHVGDSRAYLYRANELQQMTKDHTFVQTLVDSGEITQEQAAVHPKRNLMMRAIDGIHAVEVDLSVRETRVGDRYLLCSDGLTGVLSDFEIAKILKKYSGQELVENLVAETKAKGAPDNVTVIWAEIVSEEDSSAATMIGAARA